MNDILRAILDYVRTPQTDYALLITGPWGCGKTYFWKKVVEPKLRQPNDNGTTWRPLYASLYGCLSTKDIDTQFLLASCPGLKGEWATRLASVGGGTFKPLLRAVTHFELPAIDLRWLISTKRAVLCFDDLERTRLPMKEALGYINTFVEHDQAKVIILCNEEAICDAPDKETYAATKEKVVGASLAFQPELDMVFRTLIDEYRSPPEFHQFLSNNAKLLRRLFDRSETQNIRALRRALSALAVIFDALDSNKINPNELAKQLIYVVALASFELHGRAANVDALRSILTSKHMTSAGFAASLSSRDTDGEEPYEKQFNDRYFHDLGLTEWGDVVGCAPICDFLITGLLDRGALESWANELTKPPDERQERINRLLNDPCDMQDDEFKTATASTIEDVEGGRIAAIGTYWGLYEMYEGFGDLGLLAVTGEELLRKFTDGLYKSRDSGNLESNAHLKSALEIPTRWPRTDEGRQFRERLLKTNEDLLRGVSRDRVQALLSRLEDDPESFIYALYDEGKDGLLYTPVFQELSQDDVTTRILKLPNDLKRRFQWAVEARYVRHIPPREFVVERPVLVRIRDALKKYVDGTNESPVPMSVYLIETIVKAFDRAIKNLERLGQQNKATSPASVED